MTRRDTIIKWTAYGVALAVITIFNYYILGPLPISLPLLLPMAAIAAGILEGARFGAGFGLASGLIMATAGHAGLFCIPVLAFVGWLCGLLTRHVLRHDLVGYLLCAVVVIITWEVWQVIRHLIGETAPLATLVRVALPELLWTLLFCSPVYWANRFCCVHYGRIYHE